METCWEGRGGELRKRNMGVTMTKKLRGQILLPFVALFLMLAGCSSESPTAPTGGGGGGTGGGGTTPPVGAEVTLSAGNLQPLVSSSSTITAAVRVNGAVAPNGTAVEFTTNLGTFTDTASATSLRTTTDGNASATLTSSTPGVATVTARVNNVSRTIQITFRADTTPGPGGGTSPTISSFTPDTSRPSGGQLVTIRGTNFEAPVRVLFGTTEATVVSVTPTAIQVIVPSINLGATEQTRSVNVTVINRVGSASEARVVSATPFRYQIEILTPTIYTVAPASGPNEGNTRIVILGEGFQAPVRVFFGTDSPTNGPLENQTELEVLQVNFGQIIALTPPALGLGFPLQNQQVSIRVLNVAGNKDSVAPRAFRYGPGMRITAVSPTQGPAVGGTTITIDGWGFDDPVTVSVGGVAARVIRVSGSQIVAITGQIASPCAGGGGDVIVTNIEDGATASSEGSGFIYLAQSPLVSAVSPTSLGRGGVVSVTVANPGTGNVRFRLGDQVVFSTPSFSTDPLGPTTFSITVPADFVFDREACIVGTATGERNVPTRADITFTNVTTNCPDTAEGAVSITPTAEESVCVVPVTPGVASAVPTAQAFGVQAIGTTGTRSQQVCNTGGSAFDITSVTVNGPNAPEFGHNAVVPPNVTVAAGACSTFNVTFTPTSTGAKTANLSVTTSVGNLSVALTGSAP